MKLHKWLALCLALALVTFTLAGCGDSGPAQSNDLASTASANADEPRQGDAEGVYPLDNLTVYMGGGPTSGTNYLLGVGMADLVTRTYPNYTMSVEASTGSQENARMLYENTTQISWTNSNIAAWVYNAEDEFSDFTPETVRYVAGGFMSSIQVIVPADSDIQSFADIRDKKVAVGKGQANTIFFPLLLDHYNMTYDDLRSDAVLEMTDAATALSDGTCDVVIWNGAYPNTGFTDFAVSSKGMRLISIDEDVIAAINQAEPFYTRDVIPAGTYEGVDTDTVTFGTANTVYCRADLDEAFVYYFTKTVMENAQALADIYPLGGYFNLEETLKYAVIPIHPGAEVYYREAGIL